MTRACVVCVENEVICNTIYACLRAKVKFKNRTLNVENSGTKAAPLGLPIYLEIGVATKRHQSHKAP